MIDRMVTVRGTGMQAADGPALATALPEAQAEGRFRRISAPRRRLAGLLAENIEYVYSPEFDDRSAAAAILGPEPPGSTAPLKKPPAGLPSYLRSLYRTPLLTREQEVYLFRRYNYLKHQAVSLRDRLAAATSAPSSADLGRVESLLADAAASRKRIVESNLRLVIHIVKRCYGNFATFFDLVSDGNLALIQAVEKFDYTRGVKLGTYAAWVIRRRFARVIPLEYNRQSRFVTGAEDLMSLNVAQSVNRASGAVERELTTVVPQWIEQGLGQLSERECEVIRRRFGIGRMGGSQTLKEVGRELGITKERVRQIEVRALARLQQLISPEAFEVVYPDLV